MTVHERLFLLRDTQYAAFQAKLTPGIPSERFMGVRVPQARMLAKELIREDSFRKFLNDLPHSTFDEDLLHGILLSQLRDYDECIEALERFLPFVDNWAVCDTISPKVFRKNRERLIGKVRQWIDSGHTYTCRFGVKMLMDHFLGEDFCREYLELPAAVPHSLMLAQQCQKKGNRQTTKI